MTLEELKILQTTIANVLRAGGMVDVEARPVTNAVSAVVIATTRIDGRRIVDVAITVTPL